VPARREPLHQTALDIEQARLVVLDHMLRQKRVALARDHHEMARCHLRIAGHIDTLDLDAGRDLPEHAGLPRAQKVERTAVEADDGELIGLGLDRLEQNRGQIGPRRLEDGVALRRELGAHDAMELDRELAQRIDETVAARLEHLLETAVAREEGALAVLHRYAQHQVPGHGTRLLHWPCGGAAGGISSSRIGEPGAPSREQRRAGA
jgi:hypothetical protein